MKLFSGKVRKDEKRTLLLLDLFKIIFSKWQYDFKKSNTANAVYHGDRKTYQKIKIENIVCRVLFTALSKLSTFCNKGF